MPNEMDQDIFRKNVDDTINFPAAYFSLTMHKYQKEIVWHNNSSIYHSTNISAMLKV